MTPASKSDSKSAPAAAANSTSKSATNKSAVGKSATAKSAASKPAIDALPRYLQIAKTLTDAITAGQYAVGAQLPTEAQLCERFRISRYTAREALRQLREQGLISRRRGAGTKVESANVARAFAQPIGSIGELHQYAEDMRLHVQRVTHIRADARTAQLLDGRKGRDWIKLDAVRRAPGGAPICVVTVYLNAMLKDIESRIAKKAMVIYPLIEKVYGLRIAWIGQSIEAIRLDAAAAKALDAEPDSPALRIVRRYIDEQDRLLELSESIHPGDRFVYSMKMQRE